MLESKKILITGASRGIGRAIALACARERAAVGISYRDSEDQAKSLQKEIASRYETEAMLLPFDVRDPVAAGKAVDFFSGESDRIDGLVNCAGIFRPGLLVSLPPGEIEEQIAVNLLGAIHCAQAALPSMIQQRSGVILNVSSVAAIRPNRGQAVYAASKGALESLTRALAVEYARKGIRFLCLRPGPVDTDMMAGTKVLGEEEILARTPLRRLGKPEEIADLAVYLLSEKAEYITGSTHTIDGGYLEG
ncbi:MAG: SDR family oxidoreductase [Planctomycetota bacterium]|jgi:3-oxoacyl-[acyl-carrier protein] reductase|nr:SDR family oxidoreductase [Planctomycetota bacterium]MDP6503898.1 SDR family oxidoreductase [Planctomycetota bacterium]